MPKGFKRPTPVGETFGWLTVIGEPARTGKRRYVTASCICGVVWDTRLDAIIRGQTKSCGCMRATHGLKHGMAHRPEYLSWDSMIQRCTNPNNPGYRHYGGRGVTVDDPRWFSFGAFIEDMGERPTGTSLERIDNNLGYSKQNCRWATRAEQMLNTRRTVVVEWEGKQQPLMLLADRYGIDRALARQRHKNGWSVSEILNTPKEPRRVGNF